MHEINSIQKRNDSMRIKCLNNGRAGIQKKGGRRNQWKIKVNRKQKHNRSDPKRIFIFIDTPRKAREEEEFTQTVLANGRKQAKTLFLLLYSPPLCFWSACATRSFNFSHLLVPCFLSVLFTFSRLFMLFDHLLWFELLSCSFRCRGLFVLSFFFHQLQQSPESSSSISDSISASNRLLSYLSFASLLIVTFVTGHSIPLDCLVDYRMRSKPFVHRLYKVLPSLNQQPRRWQRNIALLWHGRHCRQQQNQRAAWASLSCFLLRCASFVGLANLPLLPCFFASLLLLLLLLLPLPSFSLLS